MSRTIAEAQEELFLTDTSDDMNGTTVAEGHVLDFITGEKHLKDRPKEYGGVAEKTYLRVKNSREFFST